MSPTDDWRLVDIKRGKSECVDGPLQQQKISWFKLI